MRWLLTNSWVLSGQSVSIKSGAQGGVRDVKDNLEYLESFDSVVINFRQRQGGQRSSSRYCKTINPRQS